MPRKISKARLEQMVEEATVDAYGESEQTTGLYTMLEEHLELPFNTKVLGVEAAAQVHLYELCLAMCWYRDSLDPARRVHPAEQELNRLRGILRRSAG